MLVSPAAQRDRSESYRVFLEESAVPKQSLMPEREKDVFETIFTEEKYRNKILTSQDVEDIRTRLNPERTKTFFDRMKSRFMAAVGLDKFESEVQDSLELLQKIKENKSLKDIPTIFIVNEQGDTALHLAIKRSNLECVKQLLNKMTLEQINVPDREGRLPIHLAVFHCQIEIVQILLNKMSCEQLFIKDNQGQIAVDYAMGVRSRHIRAAIQNKAGFDLLSFTMPNQAMQKVLSALLKKEVVMSA
ncbi:MAG: ankyrin repeat domain-containing protein, partial [Myxococcaceae bacterium]